MSGLPESFHPLIQTWFTETYGKPTAVQAEAWPLIERGDHVLALAPTGSGKTLTAFLSAISRFCAPSYPADKLTVLYISPLKALNEDIKRNLLEPLAAIRKRFENAGLVFPDIRVETRSGDTPQYQRRRFLTHPPSILALTPESLAILLLNPKGRQVLSTVKYLILDEIHAVLGNKRGAYLSCQIDRLSLIAGEFQRISLSATVRRPETAAEFIGGLDSKGLKRPVSIVSPQSEKQIDLTIEFPHTDNEIELVDKYGKRYTGLINYILNRVSEHSTILVFTDSRRRAERLCYFLNEAAARNGNSNPVAFSHHGSLSKELRHSVERRLAEGSLPCVVATASLELGIDIGSVDEVVLAGSPGSVSQALQRIGRSGHGVGKISMGRIFPFHGMDLLLATALKSAVEDRDIEDIRPIENPLDILAQLILALCVEKKQNIDELYTLLRGFYIFRNLGREPYIRTVRMLAGLGEKGRLRELKPRIRLDNISGEISALDGTLLLLYSSGGVIANRGMYSLRLTDGTKFGELDEEFVWERRLGDRFNFGGRGWQVTGIGTESMEVVPLNTSADFIPFWHCDTFFRSPRLTEHVLGILDHHTEKTPDSDLTAFLDSQRRAQNGIPLSGSTGITVEIINSQESSPQAGDFYSAVIHSFRGGAINYPLTLALAGELEEKLNIRVESFSNDDSILFLIPRFAAEGSVTKVEGIIRGAFVSLNAPSEGNLCRGERLFRNRLESSGVFGANFREAAERSLLLPKAGFGKRTPLWIMRQRSKRLFDAVSFGDAVSSEDGFPVTAEAWRSCLVDMFDMEGFRDLLGAINDGDVKLAFFYSIVPSPFSLDMVRQETNSLIYEYDERKDMGSHSASLSDKVIQEALSDAALRPPLKHEIVGDFTSRLRREISGWAPEDAPSLCDWVKERIAIPMDEWETLFAVLPDKLKEEITPDCLSPHLQNRLRIIKRNGAAVASVVHLEWAGAWEDEALSLLGPWLRYEGPVFSQRIAEVFGTNENVEDAVNALTEVEEILCDVEVADNRSLICDRENLDMLLRLSRRKARPVITEKPASALIPFLALRQGLTGDAAFLKKLTGCSAPAKLWETEFFPARCGNYNPEIIDREIREGRIVWYGAGKERIGLCPVDDLDLVFPETENPDKKTTPILENLDNLINSGFFDRSRDFWEIKDEMSRTDNTPNSTQYTEVIWKSAWMGRLSSDSLEPIRRGIEKGFTVKDIEYPEQNTVPRHRRIPPALRDRWKEGAPVRGRWFSLAVDNETSPDPFDPQPRPRVEGSPLDEECRNRDRVRLLINRWGILCRPLFSSSSPPFTWSGLLPAMRRMELSGELVVGRFFSGINSLQFATPAVIKELENAESFDGIYWMNAADPASPAGLDIEGLDPRISGRLSANRLYFRGEQLIAVSNRNGKEIQIFIDQDDPGITVLIDLIKIPRTRKVLPEGKISVETINGEQASLSGYTPAFKTAGFVPDRGKLYFW
jgi:ATP-dependent Lhr-like helicase